LPKSDTGIGKEDEKKGEEFVQDGNNIIDQIAKWINAEIDEGLKYGEINRKEL